VDTAPVRRRLILDGSSLRLSDVLGVARKGWQVSVSPEAMEAVGRSRRAVDRALQAGTPIYGINTGFGRLSSVAIPAEDLRQLQRNLILSHSAGVGPELSPDEVRAAILLRANALAVGRSGVRPCVVEALCRLLNSGVVPVVPAQGSLGASGDLAPLAHIALVLIGRGEAVAGGQRLSGLRALQKAGLEPLTLEAKEGLALINGTQVMTGIGCLGLEDASVVASAAALAAAMTIEALGGLLDAFDSRLQEARGYAGQVETARRIRSLLEGSRLVGQTSSSHVQDAYSLRCVPQVHGAAGDALQHVRAVLEREINSATDNPLIFAEEAGPDSGSGERTAFISGGNFHGQPVSMALDYAAIAVCALANISERRIERLVNPDLSGLPAFLTPSGGLQSGFMLAQYTAAALVSENKILASPASVDSIPSSANQEDHVSMGAIAARKLAQVVRQTRQVVGIELLAAAQALDLRAAEQGLDSPLPWMGPGTSLAYRLIRDVVAPLSGDRELAPDMAAADELIRAGRFANLR
jgi:histidine ammonia-lyase